MMTFSRVKSHDGKSSTNDKDIFAFVREKDNNNVVVLLNLSPRSHEIRLNGAVNGTYEELFTNEETIISEESQFKLGPWQYRVYVATQN